jgi:uncharacterized protein YndB with AHSA1/START domain
MPLPSSETPLVTPKSPVLGDGPVLECAPPGAEVSDQLLRIRAHRRYPVTREELFASWTRRTAWDSWMRLRARSRTALAPYRGGAFRLELAEGPTIHLITGAMTDIRPPEFLSLSWVHQNTGDHGSTIDLSFRQQDDQTDFTLVHRSISSRREAAWLMKFWTTVLDRLREYLDEGAPGSTRRVAEIPRKIPRTSEAEVRRHRIGATFARSA